MTTHSHHTTLRSRFCKAMFLLLCSISFAQEQPLSSITNTPLEVLDGYIQTVYYSDGHKTRAQHIADFMEQAAAYFQKEIEFTPSTQMFILAPRDWKAYAAKPLQEVYGFPHNVNSGQLVIAAEDNAFWNSMVPPVNQLPAHLATAVAKAYGQPNGSYSMMPFFDLLALHEMGHSYTSQADLKMQRHWMSELFVNIMLHTYIAEEQPELLPALETFPNTILAVGTASFKYTSLEDFETLYPTLGMGPQNYGWYQCKLHSAAKDIYNEGGKTVLQKLWKALRNHQEKMTDLQFVEMLKDVHPSVATVYLEWDQVD